MEEGACDGWGCRAAATGTGGAFREVLRGDSMRAAWSWSCGPVSYETNLATNPGLSRSLGDPAKSKRVSAFRTCSNSRRAVAISIKDVSSKRRLGCFDFLRLLFT